jgi:SAM-dependent methyltransferase
VYLSTQPTVWWQWRCVLILSFICFDSCLLQAADLLSQPNVATNRYAFHEPHDPEGIGKFYMGREIAQVMGHEAADWLERPERDTEERPQVLIDQLKLKPGEIVADIGAGTGYFSRRLARKVGPIGKVLAVDIQPEMLTLLTNRMATIGITNVVPILGTATDPKLPAASVDLVLMVDVYHEFDFPSEIMEALCRSVKPGGRVVFVEYRGEDPAVPIKPHHKMTEMQVKREMSGLPLDWVQTIEMLPRQHIIIFRKRSPGMPLPQPPHHSEAGSGKLARVRSNCRDLVQPTVTEESCGGIVRLHACGLPRLYAAWN